MKKLKKFLLWQYMLNKRMLRKKGFVILLCLIPLLVWGMQVLSQKESGIMTVMLCVEEPADELSLQIVRDLQTSDSIVRYEICDEETAYSAVEKGKADCAWIFRADFRARLDAFASGNNKQKSALIDIVVQEDNVVSQLARTNLYGVIYPHYAYYLYENFLQEEILTDSEVNEEEARACFEETAVGENLFQAVYVSGKEHVVRDELVSQENYLLQPIKGLLLVLITVCGLASAMYYRQDEKKGVFAWIPLNKRMLFSYAYLLVAMLDAALVVFVSLFFLDRGSVAVREIPLLLLYVLIAAAFCNFMRVVCGGTEQLGRWIPLVCVAMLVLCPIFLDFGVRFPGQYLFPPTYFLRGMYDSSSYLHMIVYAIVLWIGGVGLPKCMFSVKIYTMRE